MMGPKPQDITGQRFGQLVAVRRDGRDSTGKATWLCDCDCGGQTRARISILRAGLTKACGSSAHRRPGRPIMSTRLGKQLCGRWRAMLERTTKPGSIGWAGYGGRGIRVCDRWSGPDGLENFVADMGPTFQPGMQIDRIDNDGDYEPDNCRWATPAENSRNRRSNLVLTHDGRSQTATEWAIEYGLAPRLVHERIRRGWSVERALTEAVDRRHHSQAQRRELATAGAR